MSLLSCFICMLHSLEHHIAMAGGLITIFIFDLISARPWPTGDGYMYVHMYAHTYICRCVCTICMCDSLFYPGELYTSLRLCVYSCSSIASVSKMPNINICFVLRFWATGKQQWKLSICVWWVWLFVHQYAHAHIQRALMSLIETSTHMTLSMGFSH